MAIASPSKENRTLRAVVGDILPSSLTMCLPKPPPFIEAVDMGPGTM